MADNLAGPAPVGSHLGGWFLCLVVHHAHPLHCLHPSGCSESLNMTFVSYYSNCFIFSTSIMYFVLLINYL